MLIQNLLNLENWKMRLGTLRLPIFLKQGINKENSQFIIKHLKNLKSKLQVSIQGDQLRVSGKKRITSKKLYLLNTLDITIPLIFNNFRD